MKRSPILRILSAFLCLIMVISIVPDQVYAYFSESMQEETISISGSDGTIEIDSTTAEQWTAEYPYGAFAFDNSQLSLTEGENGVITLYRLGGTKGRATVFLTYEPVVTKPDGEELSYAYAISKNDIEILVEDAQPIAAYQPIGKDPDPLETDVKVLAEAGEDGSYTIYVDTEAQVYAWESYSSELGWIDVDFADDYEGSGREFIMDAEYYDNESYDVRCTFTKDGETYTTASLRGREYERPEEEVLPEMPEDIVLNAEPTFSRLELGGDGLSDYAGSFFFLTFAEGEWKKEIRINTVDDDEAEGHEGAALQLYYTEGGAILDSADQLLIGIEDNDAHGPSELGFTVSEISADKSDGRVAVILERSGSDVAPITVNYHTVDGTAKAGTDYEAVSGTALLYAGLNSLPVSVELIDDGTESAEPLTFSIVLDTLLGDDLCTLTQDSVEISLTNTATASELNNATALYDSTAVDVTAGLVTSATSAASGETVVSGEALAGESTEVVLPIAEAELSTQVYQSGGSIIRNEITFPGLYQNDYTSTWCSILHPHEMIDNNLKSFSDLWLKDTGTTFSGTSTEENNNYATWSRAGSDINNNPTIYKYGESIPKGDIDGFSQNPVSKGVALVSKSDLAYTFNWGALGATAENANQMFDSISARVLVSAGHDTAYLKGFTYLYSWTTPQMNLIQTNNTNSSSSRFDAAPNSVRGYKRHGSGPGSGWHVKVKEYLSDDAYQQSNYFDLDAFFSLGNNYSSKLNLQMLYDCYNDHTHDNLDKASLLSVESFSLYRRSFEGKFYVETATPNDALTVSSDGKITVLSQTSYNALMPTATANTQSAGTDSSKNLLVGSTITLNCNGSNGFEPAGVVVYQKKSGSSNWTVFNKFTVDTSKLASDKKVNVKLIGSGSNSLLSEDIKADYSFRIIYKRSSSITVNFSPSYDSNHTLNEVFTGYKDGSTLLTDHSFIKQTTSDSTSAVLSYVTYGYSATPSSGSYDYSSSIQTKNLNKPTSESGLSGSKWTFSAENIQWINFNLDADDILLINGRSFRGNEKIYLSENDMNSGLVVNYYHKLYKDAETAMTIQIDSIGIYYDGNGNGRIDGSYDSASGLFVLDKNSDGTTKDVFVNWVLENSYEETSFDPVVDLNGTVHKYFFKVFYYMTPKSLTVPANASNAQVLPVFYTSLAEGTPAFGSLTNEQKEYRYILSGKTSASAYSSDNHPMYGAAASARSFVDIPLGGDKSPESIVTVNEVDYYKWYPDYCGELLYKFSNPSAITVKERLSGSTSLEGESLVNAYLASFSGTTTFMLVSQKQTGTTASILANPGSYPVVPDSSTVSGIYTYPSTEYLKIMQGSNGGEPGLDTEGNADSGWDEFDVDMGFDFGDNEIGFNDYVTIILNGNQVGFSLSLPINTWESDSGKPGDWEGKGFADNNKEKWTQFKDFFSSADHGDDGYQSARQAHQNSRSNSGSGSGSGSGRTCVSKGYEISIAVTTAFLFEYNELDNGFYFEGWTVELNFEFKVRVQARFTPCPIAYIYLEFSIGIDAVTGLGVVRDSVDEAVTNTKTGNVYSDTFDARSSDMADKRVSLNNSGTPGDTGAIITKETYDSGSDIDKSEYTAFTASGLTIKDGDYYYLASYGSSSAAIEAYYASKNYYLNAEQYDLLKSPSSDLVPNSASSPTYYYNSGSKHFASDSAAKTAYSQERCEFNLSLKTTKGGTSFNTKAFNIQFSGKLAFEMQKKTDGVWSKVTNIGETKIFSGYLESDGEAMTQVVMGAFDDMGIGDGEYRIHIVALEDTEISYLARIASIRSFVYWKGIELSPEVCLELGAGIGVDFMKFELFVKIDIGATFLFGKFNSDYLKDETLKMYEPATIEEFSFSAGVGARLVLFAFTYELMGAVFNAGYENGEGWSYGWEFLNGMVGNDADDDGSYGVTISMPRGFDTLLHSVEEAELSTQAYNTDAENVQVSGYSSGANAAVIAENIPDGASYKIISAGDRDFIFYTLTRSSGEDIDKPVLVMSELKMYDSGSDGVRKYGLANPTGSGSLPYIVIDSDETGDLDFDVSVAKSGDVYTITTAWVSYCSTAKTAPTLPTADRNILKDGETDAEEITADNYTSFAGKVSDGTDPEAAPVQSDYYDYKTAADYGALSAEEKAEWTEITEGSFYAKPAAGTAYADGTEAVADFSAANNAYLAAKETYDNAHNNYQAYIEWKNYYEALSSHNAYVANLASESAKNTELKTASFELTDTDINMFNTPSPVFGDGNGDSDSTNYIFAPKASEDGKLIVTGTTISLDNGEEIEKYKKYLDDVGTFNKPNGDHYASYNYAVATEKAMLDSFGTRSAAAISADVGSGSWVTSTVTLSEGKVLSNMELKQINGAYYLAYTTQQHIYEKDSSTGKYTDRCTEERLCLAKLNIAADGKVTFENDKTYTLRCIRDYEENDAKDGVYSLSGIKQTAVENPYFSSLRFLSGKIDSTMLTGGSSALATQAVSDHDFLLFEMSGATYILLDDDIASIFAGSSGTLYPFFTGNVMNLKGGGTAVEGSGKQEVTISSDDDGNIYAVYIGNVENTTNNALFVSLYDPASNTWGEGKILAMNKMDIYEDSIEEGWSPDTANAIFLGKDVVSSSAIANKLYGDDNGTAVYNKLIAYSSQTGKITNNTNLSFSGLQAIPGNDGKLLIVSKGLLTNLEYNSELKAVMPKYTDNGTRMDSKLNLYAISYGKGSADLGEGSIAFANANLTKGAQVYVSLSAVNVGDTALRGSASQPITARLTLDDATIATWEIKDNVRSGGTVSLDGWTDALPKTPGASSTFRLTLSEDSSYTGTTQTVGAELMTVGEITDLGISALSGKTTLSGPVISSDGSTTTYDICFNASNSGTKDAENVYIQFTYGVDNADGEVEYRVLDISASNLTVGEEKQLSTQAVTSDQPANGIKYLGSIKAGYFREVKGTLTVPSSAFAAGESKHLDLRMEIYCDGDGQTGSNAGVLTLQHAERYTANNVMTLQEEAVTQFKVASSIVIPLGTTTLVPITVTSPRGTLPQLTVNEVDDSGLGDGRNLAIAAYKQNSSSGGSTSGTLSITPSKMGTGVIHVYDTATNSFTAVVFTVTDSVDGIDIYKDNASFTFYNTDGSVYDSDKPNQDWDFIETGIWGTDSSREMPLRSNLSVGNSGTWFTFETVAKSIELFFSGNITVSTDKGTSAQKNSSNGGTDSKTFDFGDNTDGEKFTVTVKTTNGTSYFDRLVETYSGGSVPIPTYDSSSPNLYWNRSFPATNSLKDGTTVNLGFYVLDDSGIASVTVNGISAVPGDTALEAKDKDGKLFLYTLPAITANGTYSIIVRDTSGNSLTETLVVDWFSAAGTDTTAAAPLYTPDFYIGSSKVSDIIKKDELSNLKLTFKPDTGNTLADDNSFKIWTVNNGNLTEIANTENSTSVSIGTNGYYLARTVNDNGTWTQTILYLDKVDTSVPVPTLSQDGDTLVWNASKKASAEGSINYVAINGKSISVTPGKQLGGTMDIIYNGAYELVIKDTAGNEASVSAVASGLGIDISGITISAVGAGNEAKDNGKLTLSVGGVKGGKYDAAISTPATGIYYASYELYFLDGAKWNEALAADTISELLADATAYPFNNNNPEDISISDIKAGNYVVAVVQDGSSDYAAETIVIADELPVPVLIQDGNTLSWTASKDSTAEISINFVSINGKSIPVTAGKELQGSIGIIYNGAYELVVKDAAGNEASASIEASGLDIDVYGVTAEIVAAWNENLDNGKLTLSVSTVKGGEYDAAISTPASGSYYASYKLYLVDETDWNEALEADAVSELLADAAAYPFNSNNPADISMTGLNEGSYVAVITQDGSSDYALISVVVADEKTELTVSTCSTSTPVEKDGEILARVTKGSTAYYELACIPVNSEDDISVSEFVSLMDAINAGNGSAVIWQPGDGYNYGDSASIGLEGLAAGNYAVAARPLAVSDSTKEKLDSALNAVLEADKAVRERLPFTDSALEEGLEQAKLRFESSKKAYIDAVAAGADEAVLETLSANISAAESKLNTAQTEYDNAKTAYDADTSTLEAVLAEKADAYEQARNEAAEESRTAYGSAYNDGDENWLKAAVSVVKVDATPFSPIPSIFKSVETTNGTTVFELREGTLTDSDVKRIIEANENGPVIIEQNSVSVFIPKGSVNKDTDVRSVILTAENQAAGMVVKYTDDEGNDRIDPFCLVDNNSAAYFYLGGSNYELVEASAKFNDIEGLWGEENILFAANRQLFSGVGEGMFAPGNKMTRAMFVTVLWRIAGCPEAKGEAAFTDLSADWYKQAVAWAAESGVTSGTSETTFSPDDDVTREQMCVLLMRFCEYLSLEPKAISEKISFSDSDSISSWAVSAVDRATECGIITGLSDNTFNAKGSATRMEVATVLTRYIKNIVNSYCSING